MPKRPHYGRNACALRDFISTDVERPFTLSWQHSAKSRESFGERDFARLVTALHDVEDEDVRLGRSARFVLELIEEGKSTEPD